MSHAAFTLPARRLRVILPLVLVAGLCSGCKHSLHRHRLSACMSPVYKQPGGFSGTYHRQLFGQSQFDGGSLQSRSTGADRIDSQHSAPPTMPQSDSEARDGGSRSLDHLTDKGESPETQSASRDSDVPN